MTRITIIQGHPDPVGGHLLHALAGAYAMAAQAGGHEVRVLEVARLRVPPLLTAEDFAAEAIAPDIRAAQESLAWAQHWVVFYPLWLGCMPAGLKAFWEQALRPGFVREGGQDITTGRLRLKGRTSHVVVSMGMPAFIYRWFYGAPGVKALERNILGFIGVKPRRRTIIGGVGQMTAERAKAWLARMEAAGRAAG